MTKLEIFEQALCELINGHSMESDFGNTPDFVLARHAVASMAVFALCAAERERWYQESAKEEKRVYAPPQTIIAPLR